MVSKSLRKQDKAFTASHQTQTSKRKAVFLIAVAYSGTGVHCRLGNRTDGNHLFELYPEIFCDICEIAEFFGEGEKNQNIEDKLNLFKASQGHLGGLSLSDEFPSSPCTIFAIRSNFLCL